MFWVRIYLHLQRMSGFCCGSFYSWTFYLFIILFIYFGLCWVIIAVQALLRLQQAGAILAAVHRLQGTRTQQLWLSGSGAQAQSCGAQASLFRDMGDLLRSEIKPVSPALAGRFQILYHQATKETLFLDILDVLVAGKLSHLQVLGAVFFFCLFCFVLFCFKQERDFSRGCVRSSRWDWELWGARILRIKSGVCECLEVLAACLDLKAIGPRNKW